MYVLHEKYVYEHNARNAELCLLRFNSDGVRDDGDDDDHSLLQWKIRIQFS